LICSQSPPPPPKSRLRACITRLNLNNRRLIFSPRFPATSHNLRAVWRITVWRTIIIRLYNVIAILLRLTYVMWANLYADILSCDARVLMQCSFARWPIENCANRKLNDKPQSVFARDSRTVLRSPVDPAGREGEARIRANAFSGSRFRDSRRGERLERIESRSTRDVRAKPFFRTKKTG